MTPRQSEVYELVRAGCSQNEIAASLGIYPKTVEAHVSSIRRELGVPPHRPLTAWLLARGETP